MDSDLTMPSLPLQKHGCASCLRYYPSGPLVHDQEVRRCSRQRGGFGRRPSPWSGCHVGAAMLGALDDSAVKKAEMWKCPCRGRLVWMAWKIRRFCRQRRILFSWSVVLAAICRDSMYPCSGWDREQQTGPPPDFKSQPYRSRLLPLLQRKDPRCSR